MSDGSGTAQAYARVASMTIVAGDLIQTIPAEIRLYRRQTSWRSPSIACVLFILVRYVGLLSMIVSTAGYFGNFSERTCSWYYWFAPATRIAATSISGLLLAWRTYCIWTANRKIAIVLAVAWFITLGLEIFSDVGDLPQQDFGSGSNCYNLGSTQPIKATFYIATFAFDLVTSGLSSYRLWKNAASTGGYWQPISQLLFRDGLLYFLSLTVINALNIYFTLQSERSLQPMGVRMAAALTMILTQRVVIDLYETVRIRMTDSDGQDHSSRKKRMTTPWSGSSKRREDLGIQISVIRQVEVDGRTGHSVSNEEKVHKDKDDITPSMYPKSITFDDTRPGQPRGIPTFDVPLNGRKYGHVDYDV